MKKPPLQDVIVMRTPKRHEPVMPERDMELQHERVPRDFETNDTFQHKANADGVRRDDFKAPDEDSQLDHAPERPLAREPDFVKERLYEEPGRPKRTWLAIAIGILVVFVASGAVLSFLFAGATVTVYPKQDTIVADATFEVNNAGTGITFEKMTLSRLATQDVLAAGEQQVEERASGEITIYNKYSDVSQRLIKRTRFESPEGKIYRIKESIEVPGMKNDGTPGAVTVMVFAEEPGEEYNRGPGSFTIPGFKDAPQEGKIYAEATGSFTGGFSGVKRTVSESERTAAVEALEIQLRDTLLSEALASTDLPEGHYLFKDAVFFGFETQPDTVSGDDKVTISVKGTLHGILLPNDAFARKVAELTMSGFTGSSIRIENLHELSVRLEPAENSDGAVEENAWQSDTFTATVEGKTHFIWGFDADALARDIAGKNKDILNAPEEGGVLRSYPGIDRMQASIRPFWKSTFPEDPEDILVDTKLD